MEVYYTICFFIFGLVFGSFFNVVGYRLPLKMSLISPSSHCPKCNHKLSSSELIPVFSYLIQGGKCKNCKNKIPIFYPLFETITGILFALTYKVYGFSIDTIISLVFVSLILILILSDVLYMVVPNILLLFTGLTILIIKIIFNGISILPITLLNMIIPFTVLLIFKLLGDFIFKKESLGNGDINLMLIFGMVLGWQVSLFTIVLASFLGLFASLITKKLKDNHELPFVPYLGISALIALFTKMDASTIEKMLNFFGI